MSRCLFDFYPSSLAASVEICREYTVGRLVNGIAISFTVRNLKMPVNGQLDGSARNLEEARKGIRLMIFRF